MTQSYRRVVTGHDNSGRSIILDDARVGETAPTNFDLWRSTFATAGGSEPILRGPTSFYAKPGEVFFRVVTLPPRDPSMPVETINAIAKGFFDGFGIQDCKVDTSRDPLMHRTPTTDYIVLLSGEMSLIVDEGDPIPLKPLDTVIQQATNHTWIVTSEEPAVFIAVMVGRGAEATLT